jgi:sepiapterin reductase
MSKNKENLVIITGASQGFGKCIALEIAHSQLKCDYILASRSFLGLENTKQEILSVKKETLVNIFTIDFGSRQLGQDLEDMLAFEYSKYAHIFLFNNAGSIGKLDFLSGLSFQDFELNFNVNVIGPLYLTSRLLSLCSDCKMTVVNVSSLCALKPFETWGLYCSAKAAREMYHKNICVENPAIRVLNYAPGPMNTDMQKVFKNNLAN